VILVDTHALVWWVADPKRIPAKARRALDSAVKARESIAVSSISIWEIALLVARRDRLVKLDVTLGPEPGRAWRLEPLPNATPDQVGHLNALMNGK